MLGIFLAFSLLAIPSQAYVEIRSDLGTGSGTCILLKGHLVVLTAKHVVEGAQKVVLRKEDDLGAHEWAVGQMILSEEFDLAIVVPKSSKGLMACSLRGHDLGRDCVCVSTIGGIHGTWSRVVYSGVRSDWAVVTGPLSFGASGGGVFDERGNLVGIVSRLANHNVNPPILCVPRRSVDKFLKDVYDAVK